MTFDGVTDGSKKDRWIRFIFEHTILCATLDRADREIILSIIRQYDDWNVGGKGVHAFEGHDALAVG